MSTFALSKPKISVIIVAACILLFIIFYLLGPIFVKDSNEFSNSTSGLPEAQEAKIVELSNGDEYALTASYVVKDIGNRTIRMIAYNGSVPGPFIKVEQGAEVTINFTNNLDIETTIHSHGLRLDHRFDGTPDVSQEAVAPGETFTYQLRFPDGGTYWYHPHVREDYAQELGAYGNYQVVPKDYNLSPVNRELNLIVDDILFENDKIPPFLRDRTNFAIMGRFGNIMLVNGRTDFSQDFNRGDVIRLNITNAANARPFELSIPGARIKLVASDLSPYEREEIIEKLLINPSERYIIDVLFENSGKFELTHESHDRTIGNKKYKMAEFNVLNSLSTDSFSSEFETLREYEKVIEEAKIFDEYMFRAPDRSITLDLDPGTVDFGESGMRDMPCHMMPNGTWMGRCTDESKEEWLKGGASGMEMMGLEPIHWEDHIYGLNSVTTSFDITWEIVDNMTKKTNHDIDSWKFKVGDVIKMRVFNDPMSAHPMQHPFHMHGQRMMAISINGQEIENKVWKDSILIPVGDTIDIMVEMSNPGIWMAHCHIAEHLSSGMMFHFAVGEQYFDMLSEVEAKIHEEHSPPNR